MKIAGQVTTHPDDNNPPENNEVELLGFDGANLAGYVWSPHRYHVGESINDHIPTSRHLLDLRCYIQL